MTDLAYILVLKDTQVRMTSGLDCKGHGVPLQTWVGSVWKGPSLWTMRGRLGCA
jgi:hypothetical protein